MPYEGKAERILSGSLNLHQPGSEIPDYDAQKISNFTYDANSNLRSRKGHTAVCNASNVDQLLKTLGSRWQAINTARFVGYQNYLWKVGAGQAQKDCATVISTAGSRKSNGTSDHRWVPEAPTTKPTVKAAPTASTFIDEDFSEGWTVDPPGFDSIWQDPDDASVHHLQIFGDFGDETFSAVKTVSMDLATGFHIDDVHKITLWCKQWKKVEGVTFEVDVGNGDFVTDSYLSKMQLVNKIIGKRDEAVFYIRKRPFGVDRYAQDKKRYGHFDRIGSTPEKDWHTVVKLRIKVDFSDSTKFRFIKWELIGDEDNRLEGDDFQVAYTYVNDDGHESNPSPLSDPVTANRAGLVVSEMADSADPQVTKKHIYLTGGTLGGFWRVNGSGDDTASAEGFTGTTYDIIQGEDDITALGIEMENDHDDPPEGNVIAGPYYDRLLIAQSADHPERVWWSKQSKPYAFPGADQAIGNWNDVGTTGEKVMAITTRPHTALIYKENSVWILSGDPGDLTGDFHDSNAQMGISSPNGVVKAGSVDYAHMSEGIYVFNGASPSKVSQKIDPIFKGRSVTLSDGTTADPISNVTNTALGFRDNVLWFSYDTSGGRKTIKLDIEGSRWSSDTRGFTAFYYEGQGGTFLGALSTGTVVSLEQGSTDSGSPISVAYLSKDYDMGRPDLDKKFEDFTIETDGDPLTLTAYLNGRQPDAATVALGSTSGGREVFKLNASAGRRARTIAIGVTGSTTNETVINKLIFNYYDEAREAKSYDTEVLNAGTHKVKLIRELLPSLENAADVTFSLLTDLPGFALTSRESHAIAANLLRRAEPIVMDAEWYAHDFQVIGSGNGYFHIFDLQALVQIIGTYLHGTKGEYYLSDPLDFNSERVKLIKEIEVVYSTLGSALLTLSTDLPGSVITARSSHTLPATSGEQSIKIRINGYTKGRLYQVKLQPTADCRVEAIRFYLKFIGERGATSWQWVDLPLEKTQDAIWVPLMFRKDQAA